MRVRSGRIETTASFDFDEHVETLIRNYEIFRGINARKLPDRGVQFYSYVVRDASGVSPEYLRPLTEAGLRIMRGETPRSAV
jgi:hypothetical protein